MQSQNRWFEIDLIKAVAILTVVLIHALDTGAGWTFNTGLEKFLGDFTQFAVPFFLLAAGFLFPKTGISGWQLTRKLWQRILPPYLFCSLIMTGLRWMGFEPRLTALRPPDLMLDLFWGRALGIYYFVFVIVYLYAFSLWWRTWPLKWLYLLWGLEVLGTIFFCFHLFWFFPPEPDWFGLILFRHPVIHLLPYVTGWLLSLHYHRIRSFISRHGGRLIGIFWVLDLLTLILLQFFEAFPPHQLLLRLHFYLFFSAVLCIGIRWPQKWPPIRFLSETSYAIYLIHLPFVKLVKHFLPNLGLGMVPANIFLAWVGGWLGSVLLIKLCRKLLGKRSIYVIGG